MKPLTLTRKVTTDHEPLDLRHLTPDRTQDISFDNLGKLQVMCRGESRELGQDFDIADGNRNTLRLAGDLSNCSHVGSLMRSGVLEVASSVGSHLAAQMRGGSLRVEGNAGDHAFCEMRGGDVTVSGNVGHFAGGAQSKGMRGGQVVVEGSAGRWLATRMRRGTIVVYGDIGPGAASRLIAGTLVVCGRAEPPFGAGMQRGTVVFTPPPSNEPPPFESDSTDGRVRSIVGFTAPEPAELSFLQLLLRELEPLLPPDILQQAHSQKAFRALGDRAVGGQGEILWLRRSGPAQPAW
ncbi:MAG: formylmethanofuran dehydrogenase subunit C [Aureliella sp.]